MYEESTRTYFIPGDIVSIKHDLENKPNMLVQTVDKSIIKSDKGILLGVTCIWFNAHSELQKHRFNTKDLEKL